MTVADRVDLVPGGAVRFITVTADATWRQLGGLIRCINVLLIAPVGNATSVQISHKTNPAANELITLSGGMQIQLEIDDLSLIWYKAVSGSPGLSVVVVFIPG